MSQYGYSHGNPFGDPDHYTRGTGEDEIDRFNQWMRSQSWWHVPRTETDQAMLQQQLRQMGIHLPDNFHIDEAGNINQKSRAGTVAKVAAIGGGAALGGLGLAGLGPLGFLGGGGGAAAGAGASAIPAMEGGGTLAANLGGAGALGSLGAGAALPSAAIGSGMLGPIAGGTGSDVAGMASGAGAGAAGDIASRVRNPIQNGNGGGFGAEDLIKLLAGGGLAAYGASQNHGPAYPPELDEILKLQKQRMESQGPLYDSILKLSKSRLPTSVQG